MAMKNCACPCGTTLYVEGGSPNAWNGKKYNCRCGRIYIAKYGNWTKTFDPYDEPSFQVESSYRINVGHHSERVLLEDVRKASSIGDILRNIDSAETEEELDEHLDAYLEYMELGR